MILSTSRGINRKCCRGRCGWAVFPTIAPDPLPRVLPALQKQYPDLRLELRETQTAVLLDELARGSLHLLILALPVGNGEIETLKLFDDPFLLAVPADDPLPAKARVNAHDVSQRQLILLEEGHCLRDQALAFCAMQNSEADRRSRRHQSRDGDPNGRQRLRRNFASTHRARRQAC